MAIYNYFYEDSVKQDLVNCKKIEKFDKREFKIFSAASILGMAAYGILKSKGAGDLESTYPMMAMYLGCYLESLNTLKRLVASKKRITDLSEMLCSVKKDEVYELLLDSELETTRIETSSNGEEFRKTEIDDFVVNGDVIVSQEYNEYYDENQKEKSCNVGVVSDYKKLSKALK